MYRTESFKEQLANIVDPDEVAHNEPPHLNLRCLQVQPFHFRRLRVFNFLSFSDNFFILPINLNIHVIHFKEASGRFLFHFLEVFEKCIEYIRIFFIHFREILTFW